MGILAIFNTKSLDLLMNQPKPPKRNKKQLTVHWYYLRNPQRDNWNEWYGFAPHGGYVLKVEDIRSPINNNWIEGHHTPEGIERLAEEHDLEFHQGEYVIEIDLGEV